MEVNGYLIPPPTNTPQCIMILPKDKKHKQPRRCGCSTTAQELKQAERLILQLAGQTDEVMISTMKRIIDQRLCDNTHRKQLHTPNQSRTLERLIEAYRESYATTVPSDLQYVQTEEELFGRYRARGRESAVADILPKQINKQQAKRGWVYVFSWPRQPGFLKIGYARASAEKRTNVWQGCHPEATVLYKVELPFSERMEALVHAELADKRHSLREDCSRCGRRHTEWFAVTLEEVKRVLDDWCKIAVSPLYTEDGILSKQWRRVIVGHSKVTASILLEYLKETPLSSVDRSHGVSEQPQLFSARILSRRENMVESHPSALHVLRDKQIDDLAAQLKEQTLENRTMGRSPVA